MRRFRPESYLRWLDWYEEQRQARIDAGFAAGQDVEELDDYLTDMSADGMLHSYPVILHDKHRSTELDGPRVIKQGATEHKAGGITCVSRAFE
jgi:hypothetical protein